MPHFNVFRSRRIENSSITEDSDSFNDGQMSRPSEHRQQPPSGFRSILARNRRARPQTNAHTDDEEWQLLDRPPNMRTTVEDYSSEEESAPSDVTDSSMHYISESSAVDSRVPLVEREDEPMSSRLYEQFSNPATPHASHVTRLELQDRDVEDHHRSNGSPRPYMDVTPMPGRWQPLDISATQQDAYHHPSHSTHPPISHSPALSSSSASIVYTLDDGTRVQVPTASYQRGRSSHRQANRKDKTYYIIPPGMNVIFRDKDGSEITRVGDFTGTSTPMRYQEAPIILRDESGRIIYQTGMSDDGNSGVAGNTYSRDGPSVVHLGQFVPNGLYGSRSPSPITISLGYRGQKQSPACNDHNSHHTQQVYRSPSVQSAPSMVYTGQDRTPRASTSDLRYQASNTRSYDSLRVRKIYP